MTIPPPNFADVAYGTHPKQKLDIYLPTQGKGPFPIVFWIHGGGWFGGDKVSKWVGAEAAPYLGKGCAFVSINYRLIDDAVAEKISPPIVAVLGDSRRALQYVRLHAADWNLDPGRIVISGGSAGAASALYLVCAGEQAKPDSPDPVERVSTKVLGAILGVAQTSFDPQRIQEWVPGCFWGYWACEPESPRKGPECEAAFKKYLADRDKWLPTIKQYSPDWLISKDTPPVYFSYGQSPPAAGVAPSSDELIHNPLWAIGFQKLAQEKGAETYLQYPGHPAEKYSSRANFVFHLLGISPK